MHLAEGILALNDPELRSLYDLKIFVQCVFSNLESKRSLNRSSLIRCDNDLMLARRIQRDVAERGRNVEGVLQQ